MKEKTKEVFLYGFFGILTTVINTLIFYLLTTVVKTNYIFGNIIAWILSVLFAFVTNKYFVFNSKSWKRQIWIRESIDFFSARALTGVLDLILMFVFVSTLHLDPLFAKIAVNIVVITLNYILSKLWIFKK